MKTSTTTIINNEYNYSNIIPTTDVVFQLVKYFDSLYKHFQKLIEEDEEKNKKLVPEYQEFLYKDTYSFDFEVNITSKSINTICCKDLDQFISAVNGGNLNNIYALKIELNLDFGRGKGNNIENHKNKFKISFKPYEIIFIRKSNYNDQSMTEIEEMTKKALASFPVSNTIFYSKSDK